MPVDSDCESKIYRRAPVVWCGSASHTTISFIMTEPSYQPFSTFTICIVTIL